MADGQGTFYGIGLDNTELKKKAQESVSEFKKIDSAADATTSHMGKLQKAFQSGLDFDGSSLEELKASIAASKDYLKELRIQYKDTQNAIQKVGGAGMNSALDAELKRLKEDIDLEDAALKGLETTLQRMKGGAATSFRQQMMQISNTMKQMILDGEEDTETYRELEEQLRKLTIAQKEFQTEQKNLHSTAVSSIAGLASGLQGLMGAYSVGSGIVGMFTKDQEKLAQVQTKMQATMAMLMGLQQVANTLNSSSAFRITTVRKATELWHAWNLKTGTGLVKLGASAGVARTATLALHGALLGLGGAAVIAAIAVLSKLRKEQEKAREIAKKWKDETSSSLGAQLASYRSLQAQWEAANGSLKEQNKLYREGKGEIEKMGIAINSINDYEKVMTEASNSVVSALKSKAEATAYLAIMEDLYKEAILNRLKAEDKESTKPKWWQNVITAFAMSGAAESGGDSMAMQSAMDEMWSEKNAGKFIKEAEKSEEKIETASQKMVEALKAFRDKMKESGLFETEDSDNANSYADALSQVNRKSRELETSLADLSRAQAESTANFKMQLAQDLGNWTSYYDQKMALAANSYAKQREAAKNALDNTSEDINKQIRDWTKKGWDTSSLQEQLDKAKAVYVKTIENIDKEEEQNFIKMMLDRADKMLEMEERYKKEAQDAIQADADDVQAKEDQYMQDLAEYGTYEDKKLAIHMKWLGKINAADDDQKALYRRAYAQELAALDQQYSATYALIFANAQDLTNNQLKDAIEATQEAIKKAESEGDIESLTRLYEELREKLEVSSNRTSGWGFFGIVEGFKNAGLAIKEYKTALADNDRDGVMNALSKQQTAYQQIANGMSQVVGFAGEFGNAMQSFGGKIGEIGEGLSSMADSISGVYSAIKSGDKGAIIGTAVSSILGIASMIGNQIQENKKAQEEWNRTVRQCAYEYELLNLKQYEYKEQNLFGIENPFKKAAQDAELYRQSMAVLVDMQKQLSEGQVQTGTRKEVDWGNVGKGAGLGAAAGAAIGSVIPGIGTAIGAVVGGLIGLFTGAVAGAMATKVVPVFETLASHYDFLFDSETYELNPKIIADYDKLDEDTKQIIDNWEEIREKALAAEEEMRQSFKDMAGDVGNTLSDKLVEAFRNQKLYSAIDDFHAYMIDTVEDILEQLIFASTFGTMFDELERRMMDSFGVGGDGSIIDDLMWMEEEYQKRLDQYDSAMEAAQESMKQMGYDLWKSDESTRTAVSKPSLGASQDSVDESNARLTTIQSHTYEMNENTKAMRAIQTVLQSNVASILDHVAGIHKDTSSIKESVESVAKDVEYIKSDTGNMVKNGVIIKR